MRRQGQVALEFLILGGFVLFVLAIFAFVLQQRSAMAKQEEQRAALQAVAEAISTEVSNAHRVQDGYTRNFELPVTADKEQYTITIESGAELTVKSENEEYVAFLPANVTVDNTGMPLPSGNISPGRIAITKQAGIITISSVTSIS